MLTVAPSKDDFKECDMQTLVSRLNECSRDVAERAAKATVEIQKLYALSDRERFPSCASGEYETKRPSSLYFADFKVAEAYGLSAVEDTMKRCGDLTKLDPKMATELYMVVNHLMISIYQRVGEKEIVKGETGPAKIYRLYDRVFNRIRDEIVPAWSDEDREYFWAITD